MDAAQAAASSMVQDSGATEATEALEIDLLLEAVFQRHGFDFRAFERMALRARLLALMQAHGLATVSLLQDRVLHQSGMAARLLRALSAAPAGMFDDAAHARQLRAALQAALHGAALPKVWLAECAGVEQAWSLAILLQEEQLLNRTEIFATVAQEDMLAEAGAAPGAGTGTGGAGTPAERLAQYQQQYAASGGSAALADYFDIKGGRAVLKAALRERIIWAQYNMATDASFNEFDLIVCRRALADYGPQLRQRALRLFHDSLALFGVLGIDRVFERGDPLAAHYQPLFAQQPWYKRVL